MRTEAIAPDDGSKHQKMENIFMTYFIGIIIRFKLTEVSDVELWKGSRSTQREEGDLYMSEGVDKLEKLTCRR